MSLKHQNSGKWAKSKAIMAKYDDSVRVVGHGARLDIFFVISFIILTHLPMLFRHAKQCRSSCR